MKKIKLSILALLGISGSFYGQSNISIEAPQFDENFGSWAAFATPSGTASSAYHRACYFITQAELARLTQTNGTITAFGMDFVRGASAATSGQFTLYLQNTTDAAYNKSLIFPSIITPMSVAYTGNFTVPGNGSAVTPTVAASVNLTTPFAYTGGGMYVAWEWFGAAASATVFSRAMCNVALPATAAGCNASAPAAGPTPTALTNFQFRPCMRFTAANTATNELSTLRLTAPGSVSRFMGPHVITAQIRNNGTTTRTNVPVALTVTGANPFTDVQTVTSIAPGGVANVSFAAYNPTASGASSMIVNVPPDQYTKNDTSWVWTQSVSCTDYGNSPASLAPTNFDDGSYGYSGAAAIVTRLTPPADATMTAVKFVVGAGASAVGMRGVLLDAGGTMIAATRSTIVNGPTAASGQVFTTFRFDTAQALTAGTLYYFGMEQLNGGFPFATSEAINFRNLPNLYFNAPAGGGGIGGAQNQMSYMGMQAVLNYSETFIQADITRSVVCNNKGLATADRETATLLAIGIIPGKTFTWTPLVAGNNTVVASGASVIITPSVNPLSGFISYSVTATHVASGCRSNQAVITLRVADCTGIPDNSGFGEAIVLYPNPAVNGKATVKGLDGSNTITVYNVLGQAVLNFKTNESEAEVNLQNQVAGHYMVKITGSSRQSRVIKLIKEN